MGGDHLKDVLEIVLVPGPCDVPAPELCGGRENREVTRWQGDSGVKCASVADVLCDPEGGHLTSLSLKSKQKGGSS